MISRRELASWHPIRLDDVDRGIRPVVAAMNRSRHLVTLSSCAGHRIPPACTHFAAHVAVAVRASAFAWWLQLLNQMQRAVDAEHVMIRCELSFDAGCGDACQPEMPEWIMYSLEIETQQAPPSVAILHRVAAVIDSAVAVRAGRTR